MTTNMSILVLSFDGYSDVWDLFFQAKSRYWTQCAYKTRLVSNFKIYPNVDTIHVGEEICWSDRVLKALDKVEEQFVLLLLEDYLIASNVCESLIDDAVCFMEQHNADYLRVVTIPRSRHNHLEGNSNYVQIYKCDEYGINLQASIWRTSFLRESVKRFPGSPWDFEIGFLSESLDADKMPIPHCYASTKDLIDLRNGILKGKWFSTSVNYFVKQGFVFDWKARGRLSFIEELSFNIKIWLKEHLSYNMRKVIKRILTFFGVKFVSKY